MNWKTLLPLGLLLTISGCATAPPLQLTPEAGNVLVAKSAPGANYEAIGPVSGVDGEGCGRFGYLGTYERATTILRNRTFNMGGEYAQIISLTEPYLRGNCFDNQYVIRATAYRALPTRPTPPPLAETGEEHLTKKLRELKELLDEGILTEEEYLGQKSRLLDKGF